MSDSNKYSAIFVSDIHLSAKSPSLRCEEPDWYNAMARPIREMSKLAKKLDVPIICAGDIFDHWNPPAELITFALQELPEMYAVPGQHDLPNHSYEDIERSGYWTLVEAGVIVNIEPGVPMFTDNNIALFGFPWKFPIVPVSEFLTPKWKDNIESCQKVSVAHAYCWQGQYKYATAPDENNVRNFKLSGYDASVFGDNHLGWVKGKVCNTGGFMRRHKPDLNRDPFIGVLMKSGQIKQHLLDTSDDIYSTVDSENVVETGTIDLGEFTDSLLGLKDSKDLDFEKVVQRYCSKNRISSHVTSIITLAFESSK